MVCMIELLGRLEQASNAYRVKHGLRKAKVMRDRWWRWWNRQCWIPPLT